MAYTQGIKAFYIGHSLSDQIPDMVQSLADDKNYEIINALGRHICRGNARQLDITSFESGIYWIKSANSVIKFIKN
ncbi:MAG TPA: hypothetical protein VK169_14815 [Saprospiraceae bacterium]|nr:hypothetical protein [Saprospiraceae bacterium]